MLEKLHFIENKIKEKLELNNSYAKFSNLKTRLLGEENFHTKDINILFIFLLKVSCEYNLLYELHALLELNVIEDINQTFKFESRGEEAQRYADYIGNNMTLLGLAAFHGHSELVKYLVEVRSANVNADDINGNTPLHQVVYGSIDKIPSGVRGTAHEEIAKYLIRHGGDINIINKYGISARDEAQRTAPLIIEDIMAGRTLLKIGSSIYCADRVRPVFEKELIKQKNFEDLGFSIHRNHPAKDFNQFC